MSKRQLEDRLNNWKSKAILRGQENIKLRKSNKVLLASRAAWKSKYIQLKENGSTNNFLTGEKAVKHQYSLLLMVLIVNLYQYGTMSLRSCRHSLSCMLLCLGLSHKIPSHSSIRNWLCKCGAYRLKKTEKLKGNYILYVDESISFGSEKILLILGVGLENLTFKKALSHNDMEVLYVGMSNQWTGLDIQQELEKIALTKTIEYVVSDQGTNLRKAYKSLNYIHIEDCTHVLANHLKGIYKEDPSFETFRKLIGSLRRDWNLSKTKSQYMPPTMRGKMRFANIFPCVNWAKKMLSDWDNLSEQVQERLIFLKENPTFIQSLIEVEIIFKMICKKLKTAGFGSAQKEYILLELSKMKTGEKADIFIKNCKDYLENLTLKSNSLNQDNILCCSDIIESYFGKFKAKVNPNSRSGLTAFIFIIATFGQPFSTKEAKKAVESVTCKQLFTNKEHKKAA